MPPKHTVTFIQLSHTYTRARAHTQWAQMWEHVVFRSSPWGATPPLTFGFLHFFHSSSPSCENQRSAELGSDTPSPLHHHPQIHQTKTPPQTHTGSSIQHTPPASQLDLNAPPFTCATGDSSTVWKVTDGALMRYSLLLNSWIPGSALIGGGGGRVSPRWCGCNFRRVPLNGSLL